MNNSDNRTMCFTFTAANSTMNLQMVLSGWGCPIGGNVYSASYTLQTSSCGSVIASGTLSSGFPPMTGLTVGQNYVLCYTWQAACSLDSNYPFVWASSTLPIELVAFDAKANRDEVDVFWTTASEINTSEFVIERTNNGQDFTEIKRLHAAGNSTSILNYKVKDGNPVEGNNYYRLKEIDFDGTVTSGKLVVTRFTKNYSKISVMPNPAQNEIAVNFFADKDALVKISIVDAKGLVVLIKNVLADNDGANNIPVNISGLQPGIYSVCFLDADKNINTRFIKQ
jgi:hypothetical protein